MELWRLPHLELELAIVLSCTGAGCRVQIAESESVIDAAFTGAVRDTIRIRRGELVAIDRAAAPPAIAWRWMRGRVDAIEDGRAVVTRLDAEDGAIGETPARLGGVDRLSPRPALGDIVFYTRVGEWEVASVATLGAPTDPAFVRREYFPAIEREYGPATSA